MNHLGNSLIMAGTESSFQNFLQRPDIKMPHPLLFFFRRIHLRYFRQEQCITACGTQGLYITFDGPGVSFQVGGAITLGGIHKDTARWEAHTSELQSLMSI